MQGPSPVAFILKGYPRLSETFVAQEILALERRGVPLAIFSLRWPTDTKTHALHREIQAPVYYLPEYVHQEPLRVWRAWRGARRLPGYGRALRTWLRDLRRDPTRNRVRRFAQALVLAHEMDGRFTQLHAHFLHTPGSVARYAAMLRGLSWSFSAHAKDIWTTPVWELREKLSDCAWGVSCTAYGVDYLNGLRSAAHQSPVQLIYHGLDLQRFPPPPARVPRNGGAAADPVRLISIGRAVPKKGFDVLLRALTMLPDDLHWRLWHLGGGPELAALQELARSLRIAEKIDWAGAVDQDEVIAALRASDLFALACRIAGDGDRDGIPNVLMEAQSQGLACVTTRISAIAEFIVDGETGLLCPPDDSAALAGALADLIRNPQRRAQMGAQGRARLEAGFQLHHGIDILARHFAIPAVEKPCA